MGLLMQVLPSLHAKFHFMSQGVLVGQLEVQ